MKRFPFAGAAPRISRALGSLAVFCLGLAGAQTLPTGMTVAPFYNTGDVSFVADSVRTVGLWEVPGKPQHFMVLDQRGLIWSLYPDTTLAYAPGAIKKYSKTMLANFRGMTKQNLRSEMGAWSMAFHPHYLQNRYLYVIYFRYNSTPSDVLRSDGHVVVERWIASQDNNSLTRDTTVYGFYHQPSYGVSSIAFGPDGYLYIATSVYSQNGWSDTTVARKILRIDVDNRDPGKMHAIPPTNPLYGSAAPNVKKEIWARGLRNVWSMAFNWQTGKLWAGDVGQTGGEEINLIEPGKNYGWANGGNSEPSNDGAGVQGPCPGGYSSNGGITGGPSLNCSNLTNPDWWFPQSSGAANMRMNCIVIGPTFRGDSTSPYYGYTFVTDVQRNTFWAVKEGPGGARPAPVVVGQSPNTIAPNTNGHNGIVHIGEDSYGNMYASYVSWHYPGSIGGTTNPLPGGQNMFHEIYRLSHPQLTPRTIPFTDSGPAEPAPAPTVSYAGGPYTFPLGVAVPALRPAKGGSPTLGYSINPSNITALTGLQFNAGTGILSGTPTVAANALEFEVTAHGAGGTTGTTTLTLTTQGLAPTVSYPGTPHTFPLGIAIEPVRPVKGGGPVTGFSISPTNLTALTGLQFNTATGILSGTPTVAATSEAFQVTAHGLGGTSGVTTVTLTTQGLAPTVSYPGGPYIFPLGMPIENLRPVKGGGPVTSFSINKNLTALTGLQFNTLTGILSGTPTVPATGEAFQVTAHGAGGTTGATTVTLTTAGLAPTVSYADGGVYDFPLGATITNLRPIKGGGPILSYSIDPANLTVKTGLQFNTSTGILSGKPMVPADAEAFTITAHGWGGASGATGVSISTHSTGKMGAGGPLVFRVSGSAVAYTFRVGEGAESGQGDRLGGVTLRIADLSGRTVWSRTVHPSTDGARSIAWDGRGQNGAQAPAGMYIVSVSSKVDGTSSRVARKTVTLDAH